MTIWPEKSAAAAYVHIPFCIKKCCYCDFVSYPGCSEKEQSDYVAALLREIRRVAGYMRGLKDDWQIIPLQSVFLGGGTPTILPAGQISAILSCLAEEFGLDPAGEFTLEANPGTVTMENLQAYRAAGFNRISLGLQAAQAGLLHRLGRIHTAGDFCQSVALAAAAGFRSINADIMFGLPGQTLADVEQTLDLVLSLPVDHLSFYSLSLEEGTPLYELCRRQPGLLPDDELERSQYHRISRYLAEQGFEHYEISNSARPGCRCRHNLTYWHGEPYYGFGAGAHSFLQGARRANTSDLARYRSAFPEPGAADPETDPWPAAQVLELIDRNEAMKEMMLLGLRLIGGVRFVDFRNRFGQDMEDCFDVPIKKMIRRGLLLRDEHGVRLSTLGLDLANQVFQEFV
ncbi:MAG: radical SAM family heme chaperone HemW [Clostridiaceae bacterium]|nr:radical SAM family heme chaperone HemW [Clostridiaceae bacterium]